MPIRRQANPRIVQNVWNAIRDITFHHQQVDSNHIVKYLQKIEECSVIEAELNIQKVVDDGLLICIEKSNLQSDDLDNFRIPTEEVLSVGDKDWYCFECHLAGDVDACINCFRVFHLGCVAKAIRRFNDIKKNGLNILKQSPPNLISQVPTTNTQDTILSNNTALINSGDVSYNRNYCSVCNLTKLEQSYGVVYSKDDLNYLLKYVVDRIRSWLPDVITNTMAQEEKPKWLTEKEVSWRTNQIFYDHMDMSIIEIKLNSATYTNTQEFLADVLIIQHNVAIYHGTHSQEYAAANLMVHDCLHDLCELRTCVDCYRHSNEKINSRWFCLPCRSPHKLVWAKQKGYPYWPAKIIRETSTHYDVRFFGGKYERSLLGKSFVKPISIPKEQLHIKSTAGFSKAMDELKYHQKLLQNPNEVQKITSVKMAKKTPTKKRVSSTETDNVQKNKYEIAKEKPQNDSNGVPKNKTRKISSSSNDDNGKKQAPSLVESWSKSDMELEAQTMLNKNDTEPTLFPNPKSVVSESEGSENNGSKSTFDNLCTLPPSITVSEVDRSLEQVTSSTENYNGQQFNFTECTNIQTGDRQYIDAVSKVQKQLDSLNDKNEIIKCAMDFIQEQLTKFTENHKDNLKRLYDLHNAQISTIKKKQWCYNCEREAIYHCCWNTAYCSQPCQQQHWEAEHKKICRRKKN